jgi:hypothetical protein
MVAADQYGPVEKLHRASCSGVALCEASLLRAAQGTGKGGMAIIRTWVSKLTMTTRLIATIGKDPFLLAQLDRCCVFLRCFPWYVLEYSVLEYYNKSHKLLPWYSLSPLVHSRVKGYAPVRPGPYCFSYLSP